MRSTACLLQHDRRDDFLADCANRTTGIVHIQRFVRDVSCVKVQKQEDFGHQVPEPRRNRLKYELRSDLQHSSLERSAFVGRNTRSLMTESKLLIDCESSASDEKVLLSSLFTLINQRIPPRTLASSRHVVPVLVNVLFILGLLFDRTN